VLCRGRFESAFVHLPSVDVFVTIVLKRRKKMFKRGGAKVWCGGERKRDKWPANEETQNEKKSTFFMLTPCDSIITFFFCIPGQRDGRGLVARHAGKASRSGCHHCHFHCHRWKRRKRCCLR
jgi:hypothetical protein